MNQSKKHKERKLITISHLKSQQYMVRSSSLMNSIEMQSNKYKMMTMEISSSRNACHKVSIPRSSNKNIKMLIAGILVK